MFILNQIRQSEISNNTTADEPPQKWAVNPEFKGRKKLIVYLKNRNRLYGAILLFTVLTIIIGTVAAIFITKRQQKVENKMTTIPNVSTTQ